MIYTLFFGLKGCSGGPDAAAEVSGLFASFCGSIVSHAYLFAL